MGHTILITSNSSLSHSMLLNLQQAEVKGTRIRRNTSVVLNVVTDVKFNCTE